MLRNQQEKNDPIPSVATETPVETVNVLRRVPSVGHTVVPEPVKKNAFVVSDTRGRPNERRDAEKLRQRTSPHLQPVSDINPLAPSQALSTPAVSPQQNSERPGSPTAAEVAPMPTPGVQESKEQEAVEVALRRRKQHRIMAYALIVEARRYQREVIVRTMRQLRNSRDRRSSPLSGSKALAPSRFQPPRPNCDLSTPMVFRALMQDVSQLLHDQMPNDFYNHTMDQLGRLRLFEVQFSTI